MSRENEPMATDGMTLPDRVRSAMVDGDADLPRDGSPTLARAILEAEVSGLSVLATASGTTAPA